jgi:hypothetical protein
MARGWESKSVEAQQEDAARARAGGRQLNDNDRVILERRRALELAHARTADDLSRATAAAHRQMLQQALAAIEAQLAALQPTE